MINMEGCIDIITLQRQGQSHRKIADMLGLHCNIAKKHNVSSGLPTYAKSVRSNSILDPFHQLIDD